MSLPQERIYTSEDYWNLPEEQRAELIDGKLYAMTPPIFCKVKQLICFEYYRRRRRSY